MVITIIIWVFWLHQDMRFLFLRRTISLAWYEYRKLIWFRVSNQSAPHNTVSVRGLTPEWLIAWSTIHSRKTREAGSTIINSYSSRTCRIWADIYNQRGRNQLISGKSEKNNCFSKFSSNSLDFFGWNLLKLWHFLYRRRREKIFLTSTISAQEIRHQFFLIWSNLTIMAHIMGLGNQSESWKIIILS